MKTLIIALVAWSVFVWGQRLNNIWGDDDLTSGDKLTQSLLVLAFVGGALAIAALAGRAAPPTLTRALGVFAVWTAGVWSVRSVEMLADDWSIAFKVVHTGLAIVSIALAVVAWRRSSDWSQRPVPVGMP